MELTNAVAVVTGANRGFGRVLAAQLLERGAAKVYATARKPETIDLPGVHPLYLDVTKPDSIAEAAAAAKDATLLINNAGISTHTHLTDGNLDTIRLEMETHYFGPLATIRTFAPLLAANGGGAILNVLSVLSWVHFPDYGAYSAAKAAAWALTNVARQELEDKKIQVSALHVGYMDTDMSDYVPPENKSDPVEIAKIALDGLAKGETEIIADEFTRNVKATLAG
ncbi:SDR family oxidoreductase [Kibdelosporangium philippinense]|uniref:SDR family oxidoreductase n=1 Tax=Kibdelosporangium philippinense TaxID=211113 RepID=A0ABS8ZXX4_9PSEU|nr:SDR family oxidoreductase [Kibdelosporangium philippinense]MCE7010857.1 SDR family oxidoreductase [Kibdelosporangium philippinense]